jgi:hypothetical protein
MKVNYLFSTTILLISLSGISEVFGQIKVGNNPGTIDVSAILEIESTNKGFLPPRLPLLSPTDAVTISNPATGLLVYNTNSDLDNGTGIYVNAGTPTSPEWGKLEANTSTKGGSSDKLIYRGATDATKTIKGGILEWRIRISGVNALVEARLITAPSLPISVTGPRLGWKGTGSPGVTQINTTWTVSNWNTWQQVDFMSNNTSHIYYLDVTDQDKFYRLSTSVRQNIFNSLLVETF